MKNYLAKKTVGFYLSVIACVLALISVIMYGSIANQMAIVPPFIWAAIAVEVLMIVLTFAVGNRNILNLSVVISAVLMAIALAQSFNSQLDALGYAYAGLYTMDQVMPFIRFAAVCAVSFLMFIVCSFMDLGKE